MVRPKLQNHFICCGVVDIDKIATWNLKLGKDTANTVIKTVADQLTTSFGGICKIYQAGADSFYVVSLETFSTQDRANVFFKKMDGSPLKDCMIRLEDLETKEDVTFSAGIITISAKEQSLESIIDLLEYAKSEAKKLAPAGITYVDDEEHQKHMRYRAIKDGLKDCIDNDELQVYVQPQYPGEKAITAVRRYCAGIR